MVNVLVVITGSDRVIAFAILNSYFYRKLGDLIYEKRLMFYILVLLETFLSITCSHGGGKCVIYSHIIYIYIYVCAWDMGARI